MKKPQETTGFHPQLPARAKADDCCAEPVRYLPVPERNLDDFQDHNARIFILGVPLLSRQGTAVWVYQWHSIPVNYEPL